VALALMEIPWSELITGDPNRLKPSIQVLDGHFILELNSLEYKDAEISLPTSAEEFITKFDHSKLASRGPRPLTFEIGFNPETTKRQP